MISQDVIGVNEAAEIIGCTVAWVRQLAEAGEIDGKKISGRAWAISRRSAEKYSEKPQTSGRPRISAQS